MRSDGLRAILCRLALLDVLILASRACNNDRYSAGVVEIVAGDPVCPSAECW